MKILLFFIAILSIQSVLAQDNPQHKIMPSLKVHLVVNTIDGQSYTIGESQDTIFVINFWFIACEPCRREIPLLNALAESNKSRKDICFLSISNIDTEKALRYAVQRASLKFEQVAKGQQFADAFGVNSYPTNIVIDKSGDIKFFEVGFKEDIENRIQRIIDSLRIEP